jgi:hypothetical protein
MQFAANGHTMIVRLHPDAADHLARQIGHMSIGARKVRADAVRARNEQRNVAGTPAVDFDARQLYEHAGGEVVAIGYTDRIDDARAEAANAIERDDR